MNKIEQVEYLRNKANISYEEAVEVLEMHNNDLAKALVELEKRGKINKKNNQSTCNNGEDFKDNAKKVYYNSIRHRVLVKKDDTVIMNLSLLYSIIALIVAPHLTITSLFISVFLGYKMCIVKEDLEKYDFNVKDTVDNATTNFKSAVKDFAQSKVVNNTTDTQTKSKDYDKNYDEVTIEN